jgi:UV DNA damage endonuclease
MLIRLGYASKAHGLYNITPNSTFNFRKFSTFSKDEALKKLYNVGLSNISATFRILYYNIAHGIYLYRMSSSLIPLATHPDVNLDIVGFYKTELIKLGNLVKENNIRITMHPHHFTVINSSERVLKHAINDLEYHDIILSTMQLDNSNKINIHVGGVYGNKSKAIESLLVNINEIPSHIRKRLTFENDDKTYNIKDTIDICEKVQCPVMLDLHHDYCNPSGSSLFDLFPFIVKTWGEEIIKIHVSSPKSKKDIKTHADYVEANDLVLFLKRIREYDLKQIDIMVEAKMHDLACLALADEIGKVRGFKRIDGGLLTFK